MFSATLFDYNGVLVDDEHVHLAAFRDVLSPLGITLSEARYWDEYLGFDDAGVFRAVLSEGSPPPTDARVQELIEAKRPCYLRRAETALTSFPGAAELLRARALAGPVAIVSGALLHEIELGLRFLGATEQVGQIIAADHTQNSKPDPEGYQMGISFLEDQGVRKAREKTIVFEDSLDGIQAAKNAGLICIGIAHSYPLERLRAAGADKSVEKIADVTPALLARVFAETH